MVGTDYKAYMDLYDIYHKYSFLNFIKSASIEMGFVLICQISSYFWGYKTLFFIFNFLTLLFTFLTIKKTDTQYKSIAYLAYLFLYYTSSFNGIRQMLAVSIIFYAYHFIEKKDFKNWLLFAILASIFHTSALLLIPIYFIFNNDNNIIKYFSIVFVTLISIYYRNILTYIAGIEFFAKYAKYEIYTASYQFNNYSFFLYLLVLLYISFFYKKLVIYSKNNRMLYLIFVFGVILSFTGFVNPDIKRITAYFKIVEIFLLSQIPFLCVNNKNKLLNYFIIMVYFISSFILNSYVFGQSDIIPYNFIW